MPLRRSVLADCRSELACRGSKLSLGRSKLSSAGVAGAEIGSVRSVLLALRQTECRRIWSELIVFRTEALIRKALAHTTNSRSSDFGSETRSIRGKAI